MAVANASASAAPPTPAPAAAVKQAGAAATNAFATGSNSPAPPAATSPPPLPAKPAFAATGRPRIGLVLGGGGAKGFAHIGVIAELERRHIPIDAIAGTSMGAVVGSIYATGNDAAQVNAIAHQIDWVTLFNDKQNRSDLTFRRKREVRDILLDYRLGLDNGKPVLPTGALGGQRLFTELQSLLSSWRATEDFDKLPIPYRAVATNIVTGEHVIMGSGNLTTAVLASMSIPGGFPPVKREGLLLVDGGISDNLPVDVARQMGVDVVIVVDVGQPPTDSPDKIKSAFDVLGQMQLLLGYDAIKRQRGTISGRDVLIEPDITGLSVASFDKSDLGIQRGIEAAQRQGDKLAALSVSDEQWAAYLAARAARNTPAPIVIASVTVNSDAPEVPKADVERRVTTRPGDTLDGKIMARDVSAIYALDEFDRVDYHVDLAPTGNTLVVDAVGTPGSKRYFQVGVVLASNFGKTSTFDLALGYTDRDFLGTGMEWRGFGQVGNDVLFNTTLFKRLGGFFLETGAAYQRSSTVVAVAPDFVKIPAQIATLNAGIDGGVLFGNWGELRVGGRIGGVNPVDTLFVSGLSEGWHRDVDWHVGFTIDTLDSLNFPRHGILAQAQYINHVTGLGGEFTRDNIIVSVQKPLAFGDRATLVLGGKLGTTTNNSNDAIGDYITGGFLNLSGLQRNSLAGSQLLFGRAVGYYRISPKAPILDLPIYIGGSIEAGNVWSQRSDISLGSLRTAFSGFVAADTPIGPMWLAYGHSGSLNSVYLVLGRVF